MCADSKGGRGERWERGRERVKRVGEYRPGEGGDGTESERRRGWMAKGGEGEGKGVQERSKCVYVSMCCMEQKSNTAGPVRVVCALTLL